VHSKWNDISGDESDSSKSSDEEPTPERAPLPNEDTEPQGQSGETTEEPNKAERREQKITAFDPRRIRGGGMRTIKGGFRPEKLEQKKFKLDAIENPFSFGGDDSADEDEAEPQ
jgi:hypothetical protein